MAQGITDGLIQSIMTSDIFALKEQFSVTGKKTAVSPQAPARQPASPADRLSAIPDFYYTALQTAQAH